LLRLPIMLLRLPILLLRLPILLLLHLRHQLLIPFLYRLYQFTVPLPILSALFVPLFCPHRPGLVWPPSVATFVTTRRLIVAIEQQSVPICRVQGGRAALPDF